MSEDANVHFDHRCSLSSVNKLNLLSFPFLLYYNTTPLSNLPTKFNNYHILCVRVKLESGIVCLIDEFERRLEYL